MCNAQSVRNDDVQRLTKQPKLTAIIQSHRLTLFGHITRIDDNTDAKRILLASPPADWRRQLGRPRITWFSTVQQELKQHHLTLPEAADLAQNRLCGGWCRRMALHNPELHARNDDDCPLPVPAPFAACCPHLRPSSRIVPIPTPLLQGRADVEGAWLGYFPHSRWRRQHHYKISPVRALTVDF